MQEKLFVYGTLGLGCPNEHILKNIGGSFEEASVVGILYDKGWGAGMGYPGIILNTKGMIVNGFLFSSDKINAHWAELDKFEGAGYKRILTFVKTKNQATVEAFIYVLKSTEAKRTGN